MSGHKTPANGDGESNSDEEVLELQGNAMQTSVEKNLKNSAIGKGKKLNITKFWFDWQPPTDYKTNGSLRMSENLASEEGWTKWVKAFINYLMFIQCAFQFYDVGIFQYPMEICVEEAGEATDDVKRSLNSVFNRMKAMESSGNVESPKASKKHKRDALTTESTTKCRIYEAHPIFEMFDVESTLSEMKMANDFYRKIMIFIMEVVKHAVKSNEKAWPIYTRFGDDETKLFDIMDALKAEFSMKCSFENQRRASRFGNVPWGSVSARQLTSSYPFCTTKCAGYLIPLAS